MSRTWPEMSQRQVRVVVMERHTLAGSSVSPHQPSIALLINKKKKKNKYIFLKGEKL
jgi:hypothetical protein